jgi:hypothetical protein
LQAITLVLRHVDAVVAVRARRRERCEALVVHLAPRTRILKSHNETSDGEGVIVTNLG